MGNLLTVRKATISDAKDIWLWRNDVQTRRMSLSTEEIPWDAHLAWFQHAVNSENKFFVIGLLDQIKVGMCRFDVDVTQRTAEISLNLNPAMRGKKLSASLLKEALQVFWEGNDYLVLATIKKENIASMKSFEQAGFEQKGRDEYHLYYQCKKQ